MKKHSAPTQSWAHTVLPWLLGSALGPAVVAVPVNWAAESLAAAAGRWFRRLRGADDLSRFVKAATGTVVDLSRGEFSSVRRVLEEEQTWVLLGSGSVKDLAERIARCLPARIGRSDEESKAAALIIARGLLEAAIADLEPGLFQKVLLARLQRMEHNQASALDEALLAWQADVVARLEAQGSLSAQRFGTAMVQLQRVLDQLPPGPASPGDICVYLKIMIEWLNTDYWPLAYPQGSALTLAAIERKLQTRTSLAGRNAVDADDLTTQCTRLVVLGAPGTGKTWLARRTARRCAEGALTALIGGAGIDEIELPLYTTCYRLAIVVPGEGIRRAVVTSALGHLPDMGGTRIIAALQTLFEERNAPTLLVVDSLDEAKGADGRIRQIDTLHPPWRVLLTSRPSSWNRQLDIGMDDPFRQVTGLQPLSYPDDVEAIVRAWFSHQPARAAGLISQLRKRPPLQEAATVPLILAFYCILGSDEQLPVRRADLYRRVIGQVLSGSWRDGSGSEPNPNACLTVLREWAWLTKESDPASGVGGWADEFSTEQARRPLGDQGALDHIAPPLSRPDSNGAVLRRFIHRSFQEHLPAEYIAFGKPAGEAAEEVLNHLWYDQDWEYAAPAAVAMHLQRDEVIRALISRVARGHMPNDLAAVDGCWEIRRFLARVAQESAESDWQPWAAGILEQARRDLAAYRQHDRDDLGLVVADDWPRANGKVMQALLATDPRTRMTDQVAQALAHLQPGPAERAAARQALLARLSDQTQRVSTELAQTLSLLAVTAKERSQVRKALLARITGMAGRGDDQRSDVNKLILAFCSLEPTQQDRALVRETLLNRLISVTHPGIAQELAEALTGLDLPASRARAIQVLLARFTSGTGPWAARDLALALGQLDPAPREKARAAETLLALLGSEIGRFIAEDVTKALAGLDVTAQDKKQARKTLLTLLASEANPEIAKRMTRALVALDPTPRDRTEAEQALLTLVASDITPAMAYDTAKALALALLPVQSMHGNASDLVSDLVELDPATPGETRTYRTVLALSSLVSGKQLDVLEALHELDFTPNGKIRARKTLLARLAGETQPELAAELASPLTQLDLDPFEKSQACRTFLMLLASENSSSARRLALALAELDPDPTDKSQACKLLQTLLVG